MIGDFYVIFYVIFGDFLVGTGPRHIATKSQQNRRFVWLWFYKVGIGSAPSPPRWDKVPTLTEIIFEGSANGQMFTSKYNLVDAMNNAFDDASMSTNIAKYYFP